jgi:hypothetical protein
VCRSQVGNVSALEAGVVLMEASHMAGAAPRLLSALSACHELEPAARDALRLRINLVSGQLGDAARDVLAIARREQVWNMHLAVNRHSMCSPFSTWRQRMCFGCPLPALPTKGIMVGSTDRIALQSQAQGRALVLPIPAYMHGPQEEGNYRSARGKLLTATQQLRRLGSPVPAELSAALTLLHSYVLVKNLIGLDDHMGASRMLARVAASISRSVHALQCTCKEKPMTTLCQASVACTCSASNRFPRHIVPILTSTVIECQRSGLRATALQYAAVLMLPEHRCVSAQRLKHESMSYERCSRGNSDSDSAGEPQQHPFLHYMPAHTHIPLDTGRM